MKDVTDKNFGVIIAFLLPGFLFLWGVSFSNGQIAVWLAASANDAPHVGGFLYATVASLAAGLVIDAIRSVVVEELFYRVFGLKKPTIDSGSLKSEDTLAAFNMTIENHFRYYQYYANTFVAVTAAFVVHSITSGLPTILIVVLFLVVAVILLYEAYDQLRSFNERAADITK